MSSSKTLIEIGNEYDQGTNAWYLDLEWPTDLIVSGGSVGSEGWPADKGLPVLQYEVFHTNDASEWQRKTGHNAFEMGAAHFTPVVANENTRFYDRDSSAIHAHDAAAGAALLCAGSCFHSVNGKKSTLFTEEREAAQAWISGASSVPLRFQEGRYVRRDDLLGPNDLRVYQRVLDNGEAWTVTIRK